MLDLVSLVTNVLYEEEPATPPTGGVQDPRAISELKDKIQKDISTIETRAKQNASLTNLANTGEDLVNYYLIELGKHYLGKYDSRIAQKRQDDITAKYVDVGYQIFSILRTFDKKIEIQITDLKTLNEALGSLVPEKQREITPIINVINTFANTPIESYQCRDPLLKGITSADNLSNVALKTLYNETIYSAIYKMLERRAGALKALINQGELKKLIMYPGAYSGGTQKIPEPLEKTLADNSMYTQRILAIGAAAIEYYKYLVNQQNLIIKQQRQKEAPAQEEHKSFSDFLSRDLLKEKDNQVGYSSSYASNYDNVFSNKSQQQQQSAKKQQTPTKQTSQRQQYAQIDLFNPQTWKRDSNFERIYLREFDSFITTGISKYIPGERVTTSIDKIDTAIDQANIPKPIGQEIPPEYSKPYKYTLDVISKDPSNQAQALMEALRLIANYTQTKKTLMQRAGQALQAIGALRTGMGPVN